ncbi:MAG: glycosyltransferase family 4 protein [Candidatus Binatia bacterium]
MSKKRLLVTASTFPRWPNDTEPRFVYDLAKRLANDFAVLVLCPYIQGSHQYEQIDHLKVYRYKYLPCGFERLAYDGGIMPKLSTHKSLYLQVPFFLLFQLLAIRRIVKAQNISCIHAHWIIPQGFTAVLYKQLFNKQINVLLTVHGTDIFGLTGKVATWVKKFVFRNSDQIAAVSNSIKNEMRRLGCQKEIYVYPMGVDTTMFHPNQNNHQMRRQLDIQGPFVLFVGRLAENKGLRYLMKAMPAVLAEYPGCKLVIIGSGVLKDQLIDLSKELTIENNVVFLGSVPHETLPTYFATADLVVAPSIAENRGGSEGFSLVCAEAMSCGTTVVTTDVSGIAENLKANGIGFIVKQKNSEEISKMIIQLLNDRDMLGETERRSREYVTRHLDWSVIGNKYAELIKSMEG